MTQDTATRESTTEDAGNHVADGISDVRDRSLEERVTEVVAVAKEFADAVDRDARFPMEAMSAIAKQGLLSLLIPTEEGGEECTITEVASVCRQLGRACSSTGLIYAMHQNQLAGLVRHGDNERFAQHRRRIAAEKLLVASSTTEIGIGGDVRRSTCAVEPDDNGNFHLEKNAPVISYAEYADIIMVTARKSVEAAPNDQVMVLVERSATKLEQTRAWDPLGFRGTCSPGWILNADGSAEDIMPQPFERISAHTMLPCAHIFWASVWLGMAEESVRKARVYVQKAARKSPGTTPPGALRLAELGIHLQAFQSYVSDAARAIDDNPPGSDELDSIPFTIRMNGLKVYASEQVVDIINRAMLITGIEGYRLDSDLSMGRLMRDARGAALMVNNDRILNHTASLELINRRGTK